MKGRVNQIQLLAPNIPFMTPDSKDSAVTSISTASVSLTSYVKWFLTLVLFQMTCTVKEGQIKFISYIRILVFNSISMFLFD
jgi:hypothetical protein